MQERNDDDDDENSTAWRTTAVRPIGKNVRAGVCVEFRSKGSPVRVGGGGVRASTTAAAIWPDAGRPSIFWPQAGSAFSAATAVFSTPLSLAIARPPPPTFSALPPNEIFGDGRAWLHNARPSVAATAVIDDDRQSSRLSYRHMCGTHIIR